MFDEKPNIPNPPVFKVKSQPFGVPPFYPFHHGETKWLINMIFSERWDRLEKMAMLNPDYYRSTYFQIPDCPRDGKPMFHSRAVLYVTPLSLAIYMKKTKIVRLMDEYCKQINQRLMDANEPNYVCNVFERNPNRSDIMIIYSVCIAIRRESFDSLFSLLNLGWQPHVNFILPYRKLFGFLIFNYRDFLDYALAQIWMKAGLCLPELFRVMWKTPHAHFNGNSYERTFVLYKNIDFEDWLSFPRRMLRFSFYYDSNFRTLSRIIQSVKIFVNNRFFLYPIRTCWEIDLNQRSKGVYCIGGTEQANKENSKIIYDQDCIIALLLGLINKTTKFHAHENLYKCLDLIITILNDTQWLLVFFIKSVNNLAAYFVDLIEEVEIEESTIYAVRDHLYPAIQRGLLNEFSLKELNLTGDIAKCDWKTALQNFVHQHGE